jgi:acetyl-CoA C-acetyltransferase
VAAEDRTPVVIGVGQVNDRPADLESALDSLGLMQTALRAAEADSGADMLRRLDWLGVMDQLSFPNPDIHEHLAASLEARPGRVIRTPDASGDGPVRLLSDAANLIASGEIRLAACVGGEAMRTANKRAQQAQALDARGEKRDMLAEASAALQSPLARAYGLTTPTEIYPLYENATRAAWGQSFTEAQAETAQIWAGNADVAAANPNAWLRDPVPAAQILEVTADNRLVSFPYSKLMVANNSVNQGAAVLVASLALARELGVAEDKLVYVGRSAAAHELDDYLLRDSYACSVSMTAVLEQTLAFNEVTPERLKHVELYSCFPCIPKMARRVLQWPLERPHSVYGGLTFGGGPVGNCMMHALAAMAEKLRRGGRDDAGLVFANGGFATHNHAILLARRPGPEADRPHDYDVHSVAERLRGPQPKLLDRYSGPGSVESYMMPYDRTGRPRFATVVARTPQGERFLAHVPPGDAAVLEFLACLQGEPVGSAGRAAPMADGRARWTR